MATDLVGFTVYVEPELHQRLKSLAAEDGRTLSNFTARALQRLEGIMKQRVRPVETHFACPHDGCKGSLQYLIQRDIQKCPVCKREYAQTPEGKLVEQ